MNQIEKRAIATETPMPNRINWLSWDLGARAIKWLSTPAIALPPLTPTTVAKPSWCPWCKECYIFTSSAWYESILFSGTGPDAALLEYEPHYCTSANMQLAAKLPPTHHLNRARDRALAKGRSYNCGHRAQGCRTVGRAWRRVGPRWQVDLHAN